MSNIFNLHAENCLSVSNDLIGSSNRAKVRWFHFLISKLSKKNACSNMDMYIGIPLLKIKNWFM